VRDRLNRTDGRTPGYQRPQPNTPPTSAPPVAQTSPLQYYPGQQPTSAPPHPHVPSYSYYPYPVDYNDYPRQPAGSSAPALPSDPAQYDPRLYRTQPQQQAYYPQYSPWGYGYPPPPQSHPPATTIPSKQIIGKRSSPDHAAPEDKADDKVAKKRKMKKVEKETDPSLPPPATKSHLHPPRQAQSAWQMYFADELLRAKTKATTSPGGTPAKLNVAQVAKDAGTSYAALDPERKAHYAKLVQESKETYAREVEIWQKSLTPEDIRLENAFRAQQRKEGKSRKANLKDPNAPKKALSAYFLFLKSIREDDELRARVWGNETETTKQSVLAAEQWRGLSDVEKKVCSELRAELTNSRT
jgi:hypothetical protein